MNSSIDGPVDRLLTQFDRAWRHGSPPLIAEYLRQAPAAVQADLLIELIHLDLEYRWRPFRGEKPRPPTAEVAAAAGDELPSQTLLEDYARRFSILGARSDWPAELIAAEYFARQRWGDRPDAEEYLQRFAGREEEIRTALGEVTSELVRECGRTAAPAHTKIRCPHCRRMVNPQDSTDQTCPGCSNRLSNASDAPPAVQLGRYRLAAKLGAGGFGTVWQAWDTELQREVAVKLPRNGRFASAEEEERFLREARASAGLRHEGIIPVFDAGQFQQTLYIVSDLIRGKTLEQWRTDERVSFREAAEVLAQVAEALDYAHRRGIIHRDLKPSNIMLDVEAATPQLGNGVAGSSGNRHAEGREPLRYRPKIMDFGLAKWAGSAVTVTLDGEVFGTPAYMSPEQIRDSHQADARSDVYSLGVILYELLTGEVPFRGQAAMVMEQVQRDEPRRPRRLDHRIPVDLETICLKCLAKEPAGRYATAQALADDLRRFLAGEPIVARPPGIVGRLLRWAKRRPASAALISAVTVLLFIVVIGSLAFAIRLARETARAEANAEEARSAAETAERARRGADEARQRTLRSMQTLTSVVNTQLRHTHNAQGPREQILKEVIRELECLGGADGDPTVRYNLAVAHGMLGENQYSAGATAAAHRSFQKSYDLLAAMDDASLPFHSRRPDLAEACLSLGSSYYERGDVATADRYLRQAESLLDAWKKDATRDPVVWAQFGRLYRLRGDQHFHGLRWSEALAAYEKARDYYQRAAASPLFAAEFARTRNRVAKVLIATGKHEAAEAELLAALQMLQKLTHNLHVQVTGVEAEIHGDLGIGLRARGKRAQARQHFLEAIRRSHALVVLDASTQIHHQHLCRYLLCLADLRLNDGEPDDALRGARIAHEQLRRAEERDREHFRFKTELAGTYLWLGRILATCGAAEAEACLLRAVRLHEELARTNPQSTPFRQALIDSYDTLAWSHERRHQYEKAIPYRDAELKLLYAARSESGKTVPNWVSLSIATAEESQVICRGILKAMEIPNTALNHPAPITAGILAGRVALLVAQGKPKEALAAAAPLDHFVPGNGTSYYNMTCSYALCASVAPTESRSKYETRAVELLRKAIDMGVKDITYYATDPDLESLRKNPEFQALMKRIKPPEE
jgi:serine/threonine protein kinase